jgi:hypothetical protein
MKIKRVLPYVSKKGTVFELLGSDTVPFNIIKVIFEKK